MKKSTSPPPPCLECGPPMKRQTETVRVIGLPSVTVSGADVWVCEACGYREVGFPQIEELHRGVAELLVHKHHALEAEEIRFLHSVTGRSSEQLAAELDVSPATLSRWENGKQPMSVSLERLFRFAVSAHLRLPIEGAELILSMAKEGPGAPWRIHAWWRDRRWLIGVHDEDVRRPRRRPRPASVA